MGEASRRGSFEERSSKALQEKEKKERLAEAMKEKRRTQSKGNISLATIIALSFGGY